MKYIALAMLCICTTGCGEAKLFEIKSQKVIEAVTSIQNDTKLVVPNWYKDRYRTDTPALFGHNQLLKSLFFLSVITYSSIAFILTVLSLNNYNNGEFPFSTVQRTDSHFLDYFFHEVGWVLFLGMLVGAFALVVALAALAHVFLYYFIGLFNPEGYHVPPDFLAFLLFAFSHAAVAALIGFQLRAVLGGKSSFERTPRVSNSERNSGRWRIVGRTVVRAALVAIATGLGSKIGGWIGGFIVFLLSTGIASYFGVDYSYHKDE